MDDVTLRELIDGIRSGAVDPDAAVAKLSRLPFADVGGALVDHHRSIRQSMPEAVYGPGKSVEHCVAIVGELLDHGSGPVLLTRTDDDQRAARLDAHGPADEANRTLLWRRPAPTRTAEVLVVTAGTSDLPVADEAVLTLRAHGFDPSSIADVGVSGLHRLLAHLDQVTGADAVIVVAGMEGALASVIGGLTSGPVVAVPTSVGYGAGLDGITALLAMHASCASGITVVGIDNGFGAACAIAAGVPMTTPRRTAWFNCHAGVAGDMVLAALVDAGADTDTVADVIAGLGVDGYAITFERVQRSGIGATWANIVTHHDIDHHDITHHDIEGADGGGEQAHQHVPHRPVREIFDLLDRASLPERVTARARAVFARLAEAEGAIHGIDAADVELHEVGALDSIIDVVGVCAALESLAIDEIRCSPIGLGSGIVRTAHGALPHPAPATMALLTAAAAPTLGIDTTLETATPTGAALMTTLASAFGPMPAGTANAVGYGAGTADPPGRANVVQVVITLT